MVFQIGVAPRRIDILTSTSVVAFPEAFDNSIEKNLDGSNVRVLGLDDLLKNKKASGRKKDLIDVEELERLSRDEQFKPNIFQLLRLLVRRVTQSCKLCQSVSN